MGNKVTRKQRKWEKEKFFIRSQLKFVFNSFNGGIEQAIDLVKINLKDKIRSYEKLFDPAATSKAERKRIFEIPLTIEEFKDLKEKSGWFIYHTNKELKRVINEVNAKKERQFFRNLEVFRLLIKECDNYLRLLKKHLGLIRLCRTKGAVGTISKDFRKRRTDNIENLKIKLEKVNKEVRKVSILNDLDSYMRLFQDYFFQEAEYLLTMRDAILEAIKEADERLSKQYVAEVDELVDLELPSWNMLLDVE